VRYPVEMCVRCHSRRPYDGDDQCPLCAFATRMEAARGLQRLDEYLGAWAAFEEWLERRSGNVLAGAT
jgi:hypothetical protein